MLAAGHSPMLPLLLYSIEPAPSHNILQSCFTSPLSYYAFRHAGAAMIGNFNSGLLAFRTVENIRVFLRSYLSAKLGRFDLVSVWHRNELNPFWIRTSR